MICDLAGSYYLVGIQLHITNVLMLSELNVLIVSELKMFSMFPCKIHCYLSGLERMWTICHLEK